MPEQREVEIALRDSVSTGLRQIGREIDAITRKMKEAGDGGDNAFSKFGKGSEDAKKTFDKTKESASGLTGALVGMSRVLLGAAGVAAGFYAVGEALETISKKRVAMQNLGTDLGFTTEKISLMQRALERMGLEAGDQNKIITSFGTSLKEVFKMQEHSGVLQELRRMSEFDFATKLQGMVNAGEDLDKTMQAVAKEWQRLIDIGKPQAAKYFADIFQIPESVLKNLSEGTKGLKAGYQIDINIAQEHLKNVLELEHSIADLTAGIEEKVMEAYNAAFRLLKSFNWKELMPYITPPAPKKEESLGGVKAPKQMGTFGLMDSGDSLSSVAAYVDRGMRDEDKKTNRLLGEIADTLKIFESRTGRGGGNVTSAVTGGSVSSGIDLSGGGGAASSSGSTGGVVPLPRSSGGGGEGFVPGGALRQSPGGGFQASGGLGRFASPPGAMSSSGGLSQHATPSQTQQHMPTSGGGGGAPGGGGGMSGLAGDRAKFAEELKDPAIRDRLIAYTNAEVGGEGPQAAQAFMEETLNRASSRGKSIKETLSGPYFPKVTHSRAGAGATDAMRQKYGSTVDDVMAGSNISKFATGNASGTVGFGGGPQTAKFGRERFGIEKGDIGWARKQREAAGLDGVTSGGGTSTIQGAGDKFGFKTNRATSVEGGLERITLGKTGTSVSREAAPHFQGFLDDLVESGAPITSVGGYNVRRIAGTGKMSQHSFGNAIDINQSARNVVTPAFQKWAKENPDRLRELEQKHGMVSGGRWKNPDFGHWEFGGGLGRRGMSSERSAATERASIDSSLKKVHAAKTVRGDVKAEVDFSPIATKTKSGDEEGKFKLLKLNANPEGAKDSEGMLRPGDTAHSPYVP